MPPGSIGWQTTFQVRKSKSSRTNPCEKHAALKQDFFIHSSLSFERQPGFDGQFFLSFDNSVFSQGRLNLIIVPSIVVSSMNKECSYDGYNDNYYFVFL